MGLLEMTAGNPLLDLGMGLLSASGPSANPTGFGQALGAGYQSMREGNETRLLQQMKQMQIQQLQAKLDDENKVRDFYQNRLPSFFQSPEAQALAGGGGPTLDNAARIPQMAGGFNAPALYRAMLQSGSPTLAQAGLSGLTKEDEAVTVGEGGALVNKRTGKALFTNPKDEKLPWYVQKGADGKPAGINPLYREFELMKAKEGRAATPFYQFLPTEGGYAVGNARTGQVSPVSIGGAPVLRAADSPDLQGRISQAKEAGKTIGEETTKAQLDMPRIVQNADNALRLSNELIAHPGFKQAVGGSSLLGIQKIPGTDARDFMNRLDQIKGGAFLEAFNSLKGGGQITEVEGKKATDAIARMDNATSEAEFKAAVRDYQEVIRNGMNRAKMRAGNRQPAPAQSNERGLDDLLKKYGG